MVAEVFDARYQPGRARFSAALAGGTGRAPARWVDALAGQIAAERDKFDDGGGARVIGTLRSLGHDRADDKEWVDAT